MSLLVLQAVGPVAVTSLLLGSGIPGIIDAPVQDNPNDPKNQHAQDVYNHAAIQVPRTRPIYTVASVSSLRRMATAMMGCTGSMSACHVSF